jgi:S-methylmethionine-dependent homocysteine/selenocysteine methylase
MHCNLDAIEGSIKNLQDVFSCPIMVYPETAVFTFPNYDMSNVISPEDYLIEAKNWKEAGAQIIGGCCGTTVEHIKILNQL